MSIGRSVIAALRRFLPDFLRAHPVLDRARRRAIWALAHCRTAAMGGHARACHHCGSTHFAFHSCTHRACPQCGGQETAEWVARELAKRVGAPYFMVTFTLPQELRGLFFTPSAKALYDAFFAAASGALTQALANPRWLGAARSGFTMVLHTWNQRLLFHPHIHSIVPGAGIDAQGRVVAVKSPGFLVPQPVLRHSFRQRFKAELARLRSLPAHTNLPEVDPAVWEMDWGVHLQPFGDGMRIIQYLGAYVSRSAISDSRILEISPSSVSFSYKDRAKGGARRTESLPGLEFVERYLRHVLPVGLRSIRRFGYCHPSAKTQRERVAFLTGATLVLSDEDPHPDGPPEPKPPFPCPKCGHPMVSAGYFPPTWKSGHDPPPP